MASDRGKTILLAEDESLLRELGETILRQAGYKVVTAPGAEELRSLVSQYPDRVDLLLTDVIMPGLWCRRKDHTAIIDRARSRRKT